MECCCDRVGLYSITHESECQCDQYCENSGKDFSKCSLERCSYVVYRTSCNLSVCSDRLILLSHDGLCINGCHSEECCDPHPEDCSSSTNCKCCCRSGDITGSHLCCNGCRKRLERRHSVFTCFSFLAEQTTKGSSHTFAKSPDLDKTKSD